MTLLKAKALTLNHLHLFYRLKRPVIGSKLGLEMKKSMARNLESSARMGLEAMLLSG